MSMELHILSDLRLPSTREWQIAIDDEKLPLQLESNVQLGSLRGFLPARLGNEGTGFECFNDAAAQTMKFFGESHFDHPWQFALGLRWLGSKPIELQAAWTAAIAYAAATGGVIFDHEEGKVFTAEQARVVLQDFVRNLASLDTLLEKVKERFSPRT